MATGITIQALVEGTPVMIELMEECDMNNDIYHIS